jgi:outer membrane biosynthesis protein TonB
MEKTQPPSPTGKIIRPDAVRVTGKDAERFILRKGDTPEQHFPAAARKEGLDAIVSVDLLLNQQGEVLEAQIIRESPTGWGFGLAALDTAKTFVYANPLKKLVLMSIDIAFLP